MQWCVGFCGKGCDSAYKEKSVPIEEGVVVYMERGVEVDCNGVQKDMSTAPAPYEHNSAKIVFIGKCPWI